MGIKQTASSMLTHLHYANGIGTLKIMLIGWIGYVFYVLYCIAMYVSILLTQLNPRLLLCCESLWLSIFKNFGTCIPGLLSFRNQKMYYIVHLPDQMLQYGPLRHHWCMLSEAKNGFFKQKKWRQFVNIWLSLAIYHKMYMVRRQIGCRDELLQNYLYLGDIVHEGELVLATVFHPASFCRFHMQMVIQSALFSWQILFQLMVYSTAWTV